MVTPRTDHPWPSEYPPPAQAQVPNRVPTALQRTLAALARGANEGDNKGMVNTLLETAGSDLRWGADESFEDFKARAKPELIRLKEGYREKHPGAMGARLLMGPPEDGDDV